MESVDVAVAGGGIVGQSAALALARRGLRVALIERGELGQEASSAAAGILAPQLEAHEPGPLLDLSLASRARYPDLVAELESATGLDVGYRREGTLRLAYDDAEVGALEATYDWQRARGLAVERLEMADLARLEPKLESARLGLRFPDDHQLEPRKLMRALAIALVRAGVRVVRAEVRGLRRDTRRVLGLDLDRGAIASGEVVIAGGSWSALIAGTGLPTAAIRPLKGQLVELESVEPPLRHVVFAAGGYLVPRRDGRVVVGATEEDDGFCKDVTAEAIETLLARARRICPTLGRFRVASSWAGLRPATADRLPLIGRGPLDGLFFATGHRRNGILLAPATAAIAASWFGGPPFEVDLRPFGPRW